MKQPHEKRVELKPKKPALASLASPRQSQSTTPAPVSILSSNATQLTYLSVPMSNSRLFNRIRLVPTHTQKSCKLINQRMPKCHSLCGNFGYRSDTSIGVLTKQLGSRDVDNIVQHIKVIKVPEGDKYEKSWEIMANHLVQFQRPVACSSVGHSFKLAHAFWASGMAMAKPVFTTPCRTPSQSPLREVENVDMERDVNLTSSIR